MDDILRFLAAHAGKGVPQTLEYLVGDVARRHGTIRAGSVASYVRADDPALVAGLCGAKKLRRCGLRTVAPTVAVATIGAGTPGSPGPGSGVRGRGFPAEVTPFDGPDDDLDPFADLVEFDDDFDDDDDDLGFDPDCRCPECVAAATRAALGDDPVLLAQLSAMLEASPDDADERIALLDGARRDGRPLLIAYEHPRSGPATDVFRILTVTGTSAHLRDSAGQERLVDVEWIEAIVETGGGPPGSRRRGRSRK